uniref:Uncharacterized protein n=1 Tax=Leersia perrieri TaxID=77586 RepID=A0A0D9W2H6_9ORYZ
MSRRDIDARWSTAAINGGSFLSMSCVRQRRWLDVAPGSFGGCEDDVVIRRLRLAAKLTVGGADEVGV